MIITTNIQCGDETEINTAVGMHGAVPGQEVLIKRASGEQIKAVVLGVGGYPNKFGYKKLWVQEEDGRISFVQNAKEFTLPKVWIPWLAKRRWHRTITDIRNRFSFIAPQRQAACA